MTDIALDAAALDAADDLKAIAHRRAQLDAEQAEERAELAEREKAAQAIILASLAPGQTGLSAAGHPMVAVRSTRRFDATLAAERLPAILGPNGYAAICKTVVDSKKAKDILAPALYALAQKESAPTVVVLP